MPSRIVTSLARRSATKALCLCLLVCLAPACNPFVVAGRGDTSDVDLATVQCFVTLFNQECHVTAIDGQRPGAGNQLSLTSLLPPGRHWLEITFRNNGFQPTVEVCAFDLDVQSTLVYYIRMNTLAKGGESLGTVAAKQFEMVVGAPNARTIQTITAMCTQGMRSLCRQPTDCPQHLPGGCVPQTGTAFGLCSPGQ